MNILGNLIWIILGGLLTAVMYWIVGLLMCITIISIPWGLQHFKLAIGSIFPFGKEVV